MHARILFSLVSLLLIGNFATAQEAPAPAEPTAEHRWLEQFAGSWKSKSTMPNPAGEAEAPCEGTVESKMVGGLWVVSEIKNQMGPVSMHGVQTIGYDPEQKKYVGTWVDSMTTHLWQYSGTVDKTGKTLALEAEGPNCMEEGKMAMYRDSYTVESKDLIRFESAMKTEDGKWMVFLTGESTRVAGK